MLINPEESTVAIASLEECQVATDHNARVIDVCGVKPNAESCTVENPTVKLLTLEVTTIDVNGAMLKSRLPVTPCKLALIVAVPGPTMVSTPEALTLAMFSSDELQLAMALIALVEES